MFIVCYCLFAVVIVDEGSPFCPLVTSTGKTLYKYLKIRGKNIHVYHLIQRFRSRHQIYQTNFKPNKFYLNSIKSYVMNQNKNNPTSGSHGPIPGLNSKKTATSAIAAGCYICTTNKEYNPIMPKGKLLHMEYFYTKLLYITRWRYHCSINDPLLTPSL